MVSLEPSLIESEYWLFIEYVPDLICIWSTVKTLHLAMTLLSVCGRRDSDFEQAKTVFSLHPRAY